MSLEIILDKSGRIKSMNGATDNRVDIIYRNMDKIQVDSIMVSDGIFKDGRYKDPIRVCTITYELSTSSPSMDEYKIISFSIKDIPEVKVRFEG